MRNGFIQGILCFKNKLFLTFVKKTHLDFINEKNQKYFIK